MPNTPLGPAEMYEQFYGPGIFQPLAEIFVEYAAPKLGDRVLDLACGTGMVARRVAGRVGSSGSVIAIDINPTMIAVAKSLPAPEGAPIEWHLGDAVELDAPPPPFDLALCQQGLQFFSNRPAALSGVRGALTPGGRVALAVWQGIEKQSLIKEFAEIEARHLAPLGVTYEDLIAPFTLGDADALRSLLETAGFVRIEIVERTIDTRFPAPETFARNMETAYGAVVPAFVQNPNAFQDFVEAVEKETRQIVQRYTRNNMVRFPMPTHLAMAYVD